MKRLWIPVCLVLFALSALLLAYALTRRAAIDEADAQAAAALEPLQNAADDLEELKRFSKAEPALAQARHLRGRLNASKARLGGARTRLDNARAHFRKATSSIEAAQRRLEPSKPVPLMLLPSVSLPSGTVRSLEHELEAADVSLRDAKDGLAGGDTPLAEVGGAVDEGREALEEAIRASSQFPQAVEQGVDSVSGRVASNVNTVQAELKEGTESRQKAKSNALEVIVSILGLAFTGSTVILGWRRDAREGGEAKRDALKAQLEVERLKLELEREKAKQGSQSAQGSRDR